MRNGLLSVDFYTKDNNLFKKWKEIISKWCIQSDFHTRFKVLNKLGEGKYAVVYKTINLDTNEKFAVKQFNKADINSGTNKSLVLNEIELMRQLSKVGHKNILNLQQVHETKNSIYLIID